MNAEPNSRYSVSFIAAYSLVPTPVRPNAQPKIALRPHFPARSPDADQQVHRQHGDLVEQEEDEQIQRDEDAVNAGDQSSSSA